MTIMTRVAKRPQSPIWEDDLAVLLSIRSCLHTERKDLSQTYYVASLYRKKCTSKTDGKHVPPMRLFPCLKTDRLKALSQETVTIFQGNSASFQKTTRLLEKSTLTFSALRGVTVSSLSGRHPNFFYFRYMKSLRVCKY